MTETERVRAVAKFYRDSEPYMNPDIYALADLFDGIAERHVQCGCGRDCNRCRTAWPCKEVRAALAVADALGVE